MKTMNTERKGSPYSRKPSPQAQKGLDKEEEMESGAPIGRARVGEMGWGNEAMRAYDPGALLETALGGGKKDKKDLESKNVDGPKVSISEDEHGITIKIHEFVYVVSKEKGVSGQKVVENMGLIDVNNYLKGGTATFLHEDKPVNLIIETTVQGFADTNSAKNAKDNNGGAGIIAIYKADRGRAKYSPDKKRIYFGNRPDKEAVGELSHEIAHHMGLNERYIDKFIPIKEGDKEKMKKTSIVLEGFEDDLMGTADHPFNQTQIDNICRNVLALRVTLGDEFTAKPVDFAADDMSEVFQGSSQTFYEYDPEKHARKEGGTEEIIKFKEITQSLPERMQNKKKEKKEGATQ